MLQICNINYHLSTYVYMYLYMIVGPITGLFAKD